MRRIEWMRKDFHEVLYDMGAESTALAELNWGRYRLKEKLIILLTSEYKDDKYYITMRSVMNRWGILAKRCDFYLSNRHIIPRENTCVW